MKTIAIVYHSGFGHTEQQAKHVEKGVKSVSGVEARLVKAEAVTADPTVLNDADAMIFGSPTYMGSVSGPFKMFMDATAGLWFEQQWKDKLAAGFTNGHSLSGDKVNSLVQMAIFAAQHGMIWIGQAEMNGSPDNEAGKPTVVNRMGSWLGAMSQAENDDPKVTPPEGDLKTAELLGVRVAEMAKRFMPQ